MQKTFKAKHVVAAFLSGAIFFSGIGYAASSSNIEVYFQPLKYFFDGVEKKAPDDQQGFIYNGNTYIPLRFVAESLGQKVGYDGETTSVYVGKQKEGQTVYMEEMKTHTSSIGDAVKKVTSFTSNSGEQFIHGFYTNQGGTCGNGDIRNEYVLNGQYKKFEAFLAPSEGWTKVEKQKDIGQVKVYADDKLVYDSGAIASDILKPVKVEANITGALKVRIEFTGKTYCSWRYGDGVGLLDAKFLN